MWTDTHTHLGSHRFDDDLAEVLKRAREAQISRFVVPATSLDNARKCLQIADKEDDLFVAVGVHPTDVDTIVTDDWIAELRELSRHPKVVALGETGLDYFHPPPEGWTVEKWRAHQHRCLCQHLDLAAEEGLNVILHNRESWEDLVSLVTPYAGKLRAVFHCYTGTLEQAEPLLAAGHLISFTGIVTFKNPGPAGETVRQVPDEGYMLETDAPYLAPVPKRGQRCEPAYLAHTGHAVAAMRGQSPEAVAASTSHTARHFFTRQGTPIWLPA